MKTVLILLASAACCLAQPFTMNDPAWMAQQKAAASGYTCAMTNGLAAYYPFDTDFTDATGLGNNLTQSGGVVIANYSSFILNSANVDAASRWLSVANNASIGLSNNVSFTVSLWIFNPNSFALCQYASKGGYFETSNAETNTFMLFNQNSSQFAFGVGNGSTFTKVFSSATPTVGVWTHLCGVYDAGAQTINLYVNGSGATPVSITGSTRANTGPLVIGASTSGSYSPVCYVDEFFLLTNVAASASSVSNYYQLGVWGHTPLNFCDGLNHRTSIIFNGDAGFSVTGANTNMPNYFDLQSWASNNTAVIANYSGTDKSGLGSTTGLPADIEDIRDLTNAAMIAKVLSYKGTGTNVIWATDIGVNEMYIMTNGPIFGWGTASTLATALTNLFKQYTTNGIKVWSWPVWPWIGMETEPGDGTYPTAAAVRGAYTNFIAGANSWIWGNLDVSQWTWTNSTPFNMYGTFSEFNDVGNFTNAYRANLYISTNSP